MLGSFLLLLLFQNILSFKMDCYPEPGASQSACEARGCVWTTASGISNEPYCYLADGVGYSVASQSGATINLQRNAAGKNPWGQDFQNVQMSYSNIGETLNIRITSGDRYEPQVDLPRQPSVSSDGLNLKLNTAGNLFSFIVERKSTTRKLFDTSIGGLLLSDKFLQIATYLPSENMYGWGENIHQQLKHDFSGYLTWGMFARDEPPDSGSLDTKNAYGVQPFYMMIEPDGKAHGVLILNSNAQEVTTGPGPALMYRTIGGMLDIYFFPGPSPADVVRQYQTLIGKPFLPAYWALGYQLSRYGYTGLSQMETVIANNRKAGIPLDTAVVDIDYMDRYKDFTVGQQNWAGLGDYVKQMKSFGMKTILIFDPAIEADYDSFARGLQQNASFIEWERSDQVMHNIQDQYPLAKNTKIMLGVVWPDKHVAFPDFMDPTNKTQQWWISEFQTFQQQVAYDGIWIDMNEPSNFGTNEQHPWYFDSDDHPNDLPLMCPMQQGGQDAEWDMPPYKTHNVWVYGNQGSYLATKTLCMNAVQQQGKARFYNTKNLYGLHESIITQQAMHAATGKRGAVISRSTFPSTGRYAGHWLGDNTARWEDLRTSVIGAQEFNIFGIPYVGSDVCGFIGTTTEELCLRWQQMGAFHSFFRNHNNNNSPPQDPAVWPSVASATKKANLFRYQYLPYLYTQHFMASMSGGTVVHPVFFEFPHDSETYNLSYQFMWGPNIMVAPALYQGVNTVNVYIPDGSFYCLSDNYYGQKMDAGHTTVGAPTTSLIPVYVRAGSVIPRQSPNVTTEATRKQPFEVLIVPDTTGAASGMVLWDDGESIVTDFSSYKYWHIHYTYTSTSSVSTLNIHFNSTATSVVLPTLDVIEVFNYPSFPDFNSFKLNGVKQFVNLQCSGYSAITRILKICTVNFVKLTGTDQILTWSNSAKVMMEAEMENDRRFLYSL